MGSSGKWYIFGYEDKQAWLLAVSFLELTEPRMVHCPSWKYQSRVACVCWVSWPMLDPQRYWFNCKLSQWRGGWHRQPEVISRESLDAQVNKHTSDFVYYFSSSRSIYTGWYSVFQSWVTASCSIFSVSAWLVWYDCTKYIDGYKIYADPLTNAHFDHK